LNEIPFQRPTEEEERAMLAQFLIAFGAALWSFLGTIHIIYTFFTNKLEPRDAATTDAMKTTNPVLTRRTNLWNGWIGFNASFGLGLLLFGTTYLLLAVGHMSLLRESPALTWLPVVGGAAQLAIAGRYFFRRPFIGVAIATASFLVAALALGSGTLSQNTNKANGYQEGQMLNKEQENSKTILAIFLAIEEREAGQFGALLQPDFEIHWPQSLPYGGTFRGVEPQPRGWGATWQPLQPTESERKMDARVIAAQGDDVVVLWHQRGRSAAGESIDEEVLGLYLFRDGKLARAQMFYFDTVRVANFLAKAQPPQQ
jgi:ketosteroid isomerase-like protein